MTFNMKLEIKVGNEYSTLGLVIGDYSHAGFVTEGDKRMTVYNSPDGKHHWFMEIGSRTIVKAARRVDGLYEEKGKEVEA